MRQSTSAQQGHNQTTFLTFNKTLPQVHVVLWSSMKISRGAFPGDNWTVADGNPDSGEDYWDDTSYRSYGGYWSGYCADIGDTGANHKYDNNMYAFMTKNKIYMEYKKEVKRKNEQK